MGKTSAAIVALVIVGSSACAPPVHVTKLDGPFTPRQPASEIRIFSTKMPQCEYSEIAIITAYQAPAVGTLDGAMEALKAKARELGADAVAGVRLVPKGGDDRRHGYSGTAIRFKDPSCSGSPRSASELHRER